MYRGGIMVKAAIAQFFSKKNSFLRKMLLTIIGLVCIPLICIQLWIIRQSTSEFHSSNTGSYVSMLQANANTYSMQLQILSDTALHMSQNSIITTPLQEDCSIYKQLTTVNQIHTFKSSTPFVSDIAVYYRTKGIVLSSSCKRSLATFCAYAAGEDATAAAQLYGFLDTVTSDTFSAKFDSSGYLLFAKPVSMHSMVRQDAVICFLIKTSELSRIFESSVPYNTNFSIINQSGDFVLKGNNFPTPLLQEEEFQIFLKDVDRSTYELTWEGEPLNLYKYTDPSSKISTLACLGRDDAEKPMVRYVNRLHFTVLLSFMLTCILLSTTVYINYRPVKQLVTRHATDHDDSELSELELLDSLFFAKDERIANQQNLLSSFLLSDLLFGVDVDPELLATHFPEETCRYFAVASVTRANLSSAQSNAVTGLLRSEVESVDCHTTRLPNSPRTLFIFIGAKPLNLPILEEKLLFAVQKISGENCAVQMGDAVEGIANLAESHQSALAMKFKFSQKDPIPDENPYLSAEIQAFLQKVCTGEVSDALISLEKLETIIASHAINPHYRSYFCYKLVFAYLTALHDADVKVPDDELEILFTFQSAVQVFALLRQSVHIHCPKLKNAPDAGNNHIKVKLLQYVNDNLTNSELCLTSAADHMNMSIYAISRLFKEHTQQNFKEYITVRRLEIAYDLLCTTDQSIGEIANTVGFEDASYFSEVFKKRYGAVPTKVRSSSKAAAKTQ